MHMHNMESEFFFFFLVGKDIQMLYKMYRIFQDSNDNNNKDDDDDDAIF